MCFYVFFRDAFGGACLRPGHCLPLGRPGGMPGGGGVAVAAVAVVVVVVVCVGAWWCGGGAAVVWRWSWFGYPCFCFFYGYRSIGGPTKKPPKK